MTEAELQAHVVAEARRIGLLVFHSTDARRDLGAGFPDLVLAGVNGCIFRELKNDHDAPTGAQVTWKYTLLSGGEHWDCWRPADWRTGRIQAELAHIA